MAARDWGWLAFIFVFGYWIGSFLDAVIYSLPREMSLRKRGLACPACGKRIRFPDNVPLISWIILRAKCRYCRAPFLPYYFVVELLTGSVFLGLYVLYFHVGIRSGIQVEGGLFVYLIHLVLLSALVAGSGIDLEFWIIPFSITWVVTVVAVVASGVSSYFVDPEVIEAYSLLPVASAKTGALALGATAGLGVSWALLKTGLLKRSYYVEEAGMKVFVDGKAINVESLAKDEIPYVRPPINYRLESFKEIGFLLPIIFSAILVFVILRGPGPVAQWWNGLLESPRAAGLLGSLFGYFIGCGVVWVTRVGGTLAFGKETMGLGIVQLMGAAGAVIGPTMTVIAFFIAPFLRLGWTFFQMFCNKTRRIPYGVFVSLAVFIVIVFYDCILFCFAFIF